MGCNGNTLAGSLTAGPLDKKTDEETLSNKAAKPCQATISPPRDGGWSGGWGSGRKVWRWQKREEESSGIQTTANAPC